MKLDLLTNATVVEIAIIFVSGNQECQAIWRRRWLTPREMPIHNNGPERYSSLVFIW